MHKSRLGEITIDCNTEDLEAAAQFWSQVLGYQVSAFENHYRFETPGDEIRINLQGVSHEPRVHIDIETDDIDAEVRRIEKLGGRRVREERRWVVMETPTGHGICICQPQRKQFSENAHQWR